VRPSSRGHSEGAAPARPPSRRLQLAQISLEAALAVEGVVRAHSGPGALPATVEGSERVAGVLVVAVDDARYGVELHLVTSVVPLHPLAERVRKQVERAASTGGLREALGPVDITFEDVVEERTALASGEAA
jgi:hypothetical protein